ncbi:MAG: hypothetical protein IJ605_06105 [Prevotella sp.]|nr:hypothetical protein [Prevotella sp.]
MGATRRRIGVVDAKHWYSRRYFWEKEETLTEKGIKNSKIQANYIFLTKIIPTFSPFQNLIGRRIYNAKQFETIMIKHMKTKTKRAFALMLFLAITIATQASTSCLPEGDTSIPAMNLSGLSERKQRIYFGFETTLSLSLWLEPWTTTETIESITWRSDNPAAAKVTETVINGKTATVKVEAYDRGFAVLTGIAKTDGGKTFKLTQKVEVSDEDIELARVSINGVDALYCRYGQSEEGEFYMFRQNPEDPDFVMREENFVMRLNANPAIFPKISGFPSGSDKKLFVVYIDQDNVISSKYFTGFNNLPFKNLNLPTATGIIFTPDVVTLNEGRDVRLYVTATPAGAYDTFMWDPIQAISRDKYVQGVGQVNLPLAFGATRTISFTGRTSNVTQDFQGIVGEELAPSLRVTLSDSDSDKTNRLRIKAACYLNEEYDAMLQCRTLYGDGR